MSRVLRPSLVVTVSLSVGGCGASPVTQGPPGNPPAPTSTGVAASPSTVRPSTSDAAPASSKAGPGSTSFATSFATSFKQHPKNADGLVIFKNQLGGCFVEVIVPQTRPLQPGERSIRVDKLSCPDEMSDAAYTRCFDGQITRDGDTCLCGQAGNPPRTPFPIDCPAR